MPFRETIKQKVKERAHYKCCLCRKNLVSDVHHIVPESKGGSNTEDNAAPLCANCHDLYGGNPDKRKFIKQNRDFWYDQCEKSSPPDIEMIRKIHEHLHKEVVTKADLDNALRPIYDLLNQNLSPLEQRQQISDVSSVISTAAISDALVMPPLNPPPTPPLVIKCSKCNTYHSTDKIICPECGWSNFDLS